jgi:shikimate kinase
MIVLLVGPSGVGKTSAYQAIEGRFAECVFRHLDGLASRWAMELNRIEREDISLLRNYLADDELLLGIGLQAVGDLAGRNPGKPLIIDVGAGFQDAKSAAHLARLFTVVAIVGEPRVVYERAKCHRAESRTFEEYRDVEYSAHRISVYEQCRYSIDTTAYSLEQTADRLDATLRQLRKRDSAQRGSLITL